MIKITSTTLCIIIIIKPQVEKDPCKESYDQPR